MKFPRMAKNSIFAILLRSPWWISIAVAAAIFAAVRLVVPTVYATFFALPFAVIGCYAAWKQWQAPSAGAVAAAVEALRAASWESFSAVIEEAFRRDGCEVARLPGGGADFELTKAGRRTLVACKRWKVARTGVEPLRELHAARLAREAQDGIYIAAGEITDNAAAFARDNAIRIFGAAELATLTRGIKLAGAGKD